MNAGKAIDPLQELRMELDAIDEELVKKLAERLQLCDTIGDVKRSYGIPMMQPHRIDHVHARCAALGKAHGVSVEFMTQIYSVIIAETCRRENDIIGSNSENDNES